ncbi:MAG: hypothetical protein ACLR56_09805 [Oscillospiraceae bacterium]
MIINRKGILPDDFFGRRRFDVSGQLEVRLPQWRSVKYTFGHPSVPKRATPAPRG